MSITCLVPARNEGGHLAHVIAQVQSVPQISKIIIIEGGSSDDTRGEAEKIVSQSEGQVTLLIQTGKGKFNAVLEGATNCTTDFILIWDADGTVPLSDTQEIVRIAIDQNVGVMGNRLKGKMEKGSMQFANWIANWGFALIWSPYLKWQAIDTLCGTKIFPRKVFENLSPKIREIDPYGDFTLIASAIQNNIPIISKPVDYYKRQYGKTNIKRWSGGILLLRTYIRFVASK